MTTKYRIQAGGDIIEFEGPDDLSESEIEKLADTQLKAARPGQTFQHSRYAGTVQDAPVHAPDESSAGGSYLRGAEHGGYMNFDDEIASAGNAAIPGMAQLENATLGGDQQGVSLGDVGGFLTSPLDPAPGDSFWDKISRNYEHNMDAYQGQDEADKALHPVARGLGEVSGAVAGTVAPGMGAARLGLVPERLAAAMAANPIKTAIATGGTVGAVSGAGAGRGNRAQSAALGGLSGMALGGLVSGGVEYAPAAAQYAKVIFNRGVNSEAVQQLTRALARDGSAAH
jgi:hypothetical protein